MSIRDKIESQINEIKKSIFGLDETIKIYCLSKVGDLTVLLLGEHAIAKSSLARDWSTTTGLDFRIVTSSEVDESLIAYIDPAVFRAKNIVEMRPGELMLRDHVLIDEFFLWNNKYRAKLHQLLEEKTYAGCKVQTKTYTFATNPLTEHYAGQIEDRNLATEDRIDIVISMFQPKIIPTQWMIKKFGSHGRKEKPLEPKIAWGDYLVARDEMMSIRIPKDALVWLTLFSESLSCCKYCASKFDISRARMKTLCAECNEKQSLCAKVALSKPRFLRATVLLAKALVWYDGREEIDRHDLFTAIKYTLPHRLVFLQQEKSIFEALAETDELLQLFNDNMDKWKNRQIFTRLDKIILGAKAMKPAFLQEESNVLQADVAENLPIRNYITEALDAIQGAVKRKYITMLGKKQLSNRTDISKELDDSGLSPYDKGEILDQLLSTNETLTFSMKVNRRDKTQLRHLAEVLDQLHKEESKLKIRPPAALVKSFQREIKFDSDLVSIKEGRHKIQVICSSPEIKIKLEKLLSG